MTSIILAGAPGVGKTTIVMDVAQKLKARGVRVGGVVSREVRTNNVRIGFEFIDLATNDRYFGFHYWEWPKGWKILR